jgi:oligosaccharide repeat unit polymerase
MILCLLLVCVNLIAFVSQKHKSIARPLKGIYFRHTLIFILCYVVVFFQCDLDYIIGISDESDKYLWIDTDIVCKSIALASMAFFSVLLGFSLYSGKNISQFRRYRYTFRMKRGLYVLGFFMLGVYLVFVPREYLFGGYNAGIDRGWANVILVLLQAVFLTMFAVYCYEYKDGKPTEKILHELKIPVLLVLTYIFIILLSGRRTEAVRMGILLVLVYAYIKRSKINYKVVLVLTICIAFLFTSISLLRSGNDVQIMENFRSVSPLTRELAGSVNTLHVAVSNFPDKYPYTNGLTFFPNFFVLIPGLDQFYQTYIRGTGVITSSAELLTVIEVGQDATYGMGSSNVADVYISFGPIGVILMFILLGYFIRYLEYGTFCRFSSPYFLVLSFCCCSQFMFSCRGTIANMFLSWSYATLLLIVITNRIKIKNAI